MGKKYPYIALYVLGYVILAFTTVLPLYLYFIVLVIACRILSAKFVGVIEALDKQVKPFSKISLGGAIFTCAFAFLSIMVRNYHDAQCVFSAIFAASIVFPTVVDAVKMLYVKDPHWLVKSGKKSENPDGHIGVPNTISVVRIAIAAVLPLLFTWLDSEQGRATCFIILVAIILSDWVDGRIARLTETVTKAGKYLDPLGDKVLFIPNSIAFILFFAMRGTLGSHHIVLYIAIMLFITIARDILFFIWFALKSKNYPQGIGAGMTDKARMVIISCWLVIAANLATIDFMHETSIICCFAFSSVMAALSIASVIIDIMRLRGEEE